MLISYDSNNTNYWNKTWQKNTNMQKKKLRY